MLILILSVCELSINTVCYTELRHKMFSDGKHLILGSALLTGSFIDFQCALYLC